MLGKLLWLIVGRSIPSSLPLLLKLLIKMMMMIKMNMKMKKSLQRRETKSLKKKIRLLMIRKRKIKVMKMSSWSTGGGTM